MQQQFKRNSTRFPCEQPVEVAFFQNGKRCGVLKAVVCDISEGGVRLRMRESAPECDRILVRNNNIVVPYQIRSREESSGWFYAGAQAIK